MRAALLPAGPRAARAPPGSRWTSNRLPILGPARRAALAPARPADRKADHARVARAASAATAQPEAPSAAPRTTLDLATNTMTWRRFRDDLAHRPVVRDDWISLTSRPWVRGPVEAILGNAALAEALVAAEGENAAGGNSNDESPSLARLRELVEALDGAWQRLEEEEKHPPSGGGWLLRRVAFASACPSVYSLMDAAESALTPDRVARLERIGEGALTAPRLAKLARALHGALEEAGGGGGAAAASSRDDDDGANDDQARLPLRRGALLAARAGRAAVTDTLLEAVLVSVEACADAPDVAALVDATLFGAEPAAGSSSPPLPSWPSSSRAASPPSLPPRPHHHRRRPLRVRDRALLRFTAELDAAVGPSAAVPRRLLALLVRVAGEAAADEEEQGDNDAPNTATTTTTTTVKPPAPEEAAPALARALLPPLLALQPHLPRYEGMARALARADRALLLPPSPPEPPALEPWLRELLRRGRLRRYASALATLSVTGGSGGGSGDSTGGSLGAAMRAVARVFAAEPAVPEDVGSPGGASPAPSPAASYLDAEDWHHPRRSNKGVSLAHWGDDQEEEGEGQQAVAFGGSNANNAAATAAVVLSALDALSDAPEATGRALDALSLDRRRVEALRLLTRRANHPDGGGAIAAAAAAAATDADDEDDDTAAAGTLAAAAAALERTIQADDEAYERNAGAYCLYSGPSAAPSEEDDDAGPPPPPPASPLRRRGPLAAAPAEQRFLSLAGSGLLTACRLLGPKRTRAVVRAALSKPPSAALGRAFDAALLLSLLRQRRRRSSSSSLARVVRQEAVLGARILAGLGQGAAQQFW